MQPHHHQINHTLMYLNLYPPDAPNPLKSASSKRTDMLRCGHLIAPYTHVEA